MNHSSDNWRQCFVGCLNCDSSDAHDGLWFGNCLLFECKMNLKRHEYIFRYVFYANNVGIFLHKLLQTYYLICLLTWQMKQNRFHHIFYLWWQNLVGFILTNLYYNEFIKYRQILRQFFFTFYNPLFITIPRKYNNKIFP